jgi:hypothetical protein
MAPTMDFLKQSILIRCVIRTRDALAGISDFGAGYQPIRSPHVSSVSMSIHSCTDSSASGSSR